MASWKEQMIKSVEEVVQYNARYNVAEESIPSLIEEWERNKSHLIDLLGGQLLIKSEDYVSVEKSILELEVIFKDFLSEISIYNLYYSCEIEQMKEFLRIQGVEAFFENKVVNDFEIGSKMIRKGAKISRSLRFFVPEKQVLDRIQTKYSMILQDLCVTGRLIISVHPLDYLSLSENKHNWHSCHALDGEYASGNLNYMTDKHTIVAYLASDEEYELPNFDKVKWNSKKWRMLFYLDEDFNLLVGAKNYPFKSESLTDKCFVKIQDLIGKTFTPKEKLDKDRAKEIMSDTKYTVHFNDCLLSNTHRGWYSHTEDYDGEVIEIGNPVLCLQCRSEFISIGNTDFRCPECSGISECVCCGYPVDEDDVVYFADETYCRECAWEHLGYCESCCEYYYEDEVTYYESHGECYCDDCAEGLEDIVLEDECCGK